MMLRAKHLLRNMCYAERRKRLKIEEIFDFELRIRLLWEEAKAVEDDGLERGFVPIPSGISGLNLA